MIEILVSAMLGATREGLPPDAWRCRNQVEVWCTADGCAATNPDEFTPMDISVNPEEEISVCAYSGCWSGKANSTVHLNGRTMWTGDGLRFSTNDRETADVTLVIIARDGVGFVRAGGLATPVLCTRAVAE